MKVLVIRFSSIGDIVLASPVFRCIKKQVPNVELHFLTKESFKTVTAANPYIDKFYYYNDNLAELKVELKEEKYDYVIDLHNNIRSNAIKTHLKTKTETINKLSWQKVVLTVAKINLMPKRHITQRSLDAVLALNVKDDGGGLDYFIAPEHEVKNSDLPTGHLAGFIAIAIGATHYTKRFPTHKLIELCEQINHPIVLIGGKEDAETGAEIASTNQIKIYNACGKFNISESADIVKRAKVLVSNDTGMLYIACALKRPVVALWGGTSPKLAVEPYYGSNFTNANANKPFSANVVLNLWCQPCSKYGGKTCPLGHFNCMEKIEINTIKQLVQQWL
jgi:ADP-heptose:LPS heptosyltransferase